jgi:hypothetical protein
MDAHKKRQGKQDGYAEPNKKKDTPAEQPIQQTFGPAEFHEAHPGPENARYQKAQHRHYPARAPGANARVKKPENTEQDHPDENRGSFHGRDMAILPQG